MKRLTLCVVALALLAPSIATAGDLDSAYHFWHVVNGSLGRDTTLQTVDTLVIPAGGIAAAVNSCIRQWAGNPGIAGRDSITVEAGTFVYALTTDFMKGKVTALEFKAYGISSDGGKVYGLEHGEVREISNFVESNDPKYDIDIDRVWLSSSVRDGDEIHISGPVVGLTMTSGVDTTNVPDEDHSAICNCAAALLATQIGLPTKGAFFWERYMEHVRARGGVTEPLGVQ